MYYRKKVIIVNLPEEFQGMKILPAWVTKKKDQFKGVVYIENNFSESKVNALFYKMQNAHILQKYYNNPDYFKKKSKLVKDAMNVYTSLFTKVLDRIHSIRLYETEAKIIEGEINLFFLICLLEFERTEKTAKLATIDLMYDIPSNAVSASNIFYDNLPDFIEYLSKKKDSLKKLNFRTFVNTWVGMFGSESVFALESYPYLLALIGGSVINAPFIKSQFIEKFGNTVSIVNAYNSLK